MWLLDPKRRLWSLSVVYFGNRWTMGGARKRTTGGFELALDAERVGCGQAMSVCGMCRQIVLCHCFNDRSTSIPRFFFHVTSTINSSEMIRMRKS